MTIQHLTCIVCPIGCELEIRIGDNGMIKDVSGNTCKRGEKYATTEIQNPERTLTSTVKIQSEQERLVPVKTDIPLPKGKLLYAMEKIKLLQVIAPVKAGDILVHDFVCKGVNLVACKDIEE